MLEKFGQELKEAREKEGLSLQQVAAKTRIDIKFLEAMEEGNFAFLPDLYVKAFIKNYASNVGIDEDTAVKKYESAKAGREFQKNASEPSKIINEEKQENDNQEKAEENKASEKRYVTPPVARPYEQDLSSLSSSQSPAEGKQKVLIAASVIGALVFLGLIYLIFFRSDNGIIVEEKPIEEVIEDAEQRYEENVESADTLAQFTEKAFGDSLSLTISTRDTSWVKIFIDDKISEEFILFPNSKKTISASNNYKITFGKSSAVNLLLNGKAISFTGRGTPVAHVMITKEGLQYLNSPPVLN